MKIMTNRERFIILMNSEPLEKAEAIILLAGDGFFRVPRAVKLYQAGWAPKIVISGGIKDEAYGSFPAKDILPRLRKMGVKPEDIIMEDKSMNTREQAVNLMTLAKKKKWKKVLLVASLYHQYRAFLTFLHARNQVNLKKLIIINAPAYKLPWFKKNKWGSRYDLLEQEFEKIDNYGKRGHTASFVQAISYYKWREKQNDNI